MSGLEPQVLCVLGGSSKPEVCLTPRFRAGWTPSLGFYQKDLFGCYILREGVYLPGNLHFL